MGIVGNKEALDGAVLGLQDMKAKLGARVTTYPGGHSGWEKYYDPAYKEDGKNIYEWAFSTVVVPPVDPPIEPPPPVKTRVAHWEFILYSDGSAESRELI